MEIQREKLFDEVWATPISRLCKAYGLSDQGLRKVCVKLQIPLPSRGHWAKIAAGHVLVKPALPPLREQSKERKPHLKPKAPPFDASANRSVVDLNVPQPALAKGLDPILAELARDYELADTQARQLHAKYVWEAEHPGKRYTGKAPSYGSWEYFCDAGRILCPTHKKSLLRVSMGSYRRALNILHELVNRLHEAGFAVDVPKTRERLHAKRGDAVVEIKLVEKLEVGQRKETRSWSKEPRLVRTLNPTGRLTLGVEQMGLGETLISDRKDAPIEKQWEQIMAAVEHRHARSLEQIAEWARSKLEYAERERERQERLRSQEEARRAEERESARRQALLHEARNWKEANLLREYLQHLETRRAAGGIAAEGYEAWAAWADEVATALDHSDQRVACGEAVHTTSDNSAM